jgi:hypothetical protein
LLAVENENGRPSTSRMNSAASRRVTYSLNGGRGSCGGDASGAIVGLDLMAADKAVSEDRSSRADFVNRWFQVLRGIAAPPPT